MKRKTLSNLNYLDFQAYVGVTKHNGGFAATNELLSLCHIEGAREVPNVGCGIGVGSVYVAKRHSCRVVGVDILEQMIEWSRLRAQEARVEDKVEFRVAEALDLPFDADRFDVRQRWWCRYRLPSVRRLRRLRPGSHCGRNPGCRIVS